MDAADVFKLRAPDKYGNWGLELRKPIQTTDSRIYTRGAIGTGRTRDTLLTPPTQAEYAENARRVATMTGLDLGRVWAGDLKPKLDLIKDRKQLGDALSSLVQELGAYGTERGRGEGAELYGGELESSEAELGHTGSLTFGGGEPERSAASVGDSGGAQLRAWRDKTAHEVRSMNKANRKFWNDRKPVA